MKINYELFEGIEDKNSAALYCVGLYFNIDPSEIVNVSFDGLDFIRSELTHINGNGKRVLNKEVMEKIFLTEPSFDELVNILHDMFPIKISGNKKLLSKKLKRFKLEHPIYDDDSIIDAANMYIRTKGQLAGAAPYFFYKTIISDNKKIEVSRILDIIENPDDSNDNFL